MTRRKEPATPAKPPRVPRKRQPKAAKDQPPPQPQSATVEVTRDREAR